MTRSIRTLIIVLTSSLFIATQSFAANLDSSDMDFAFGSSEQSTINIVGGELALLSPEEMLATEGDFIEPFVLGYLIGLVQGYRKTDDWGTANRVGFIYGTAFALGFLVPPAIAAGTSAEASYQSSRTMDIYNREHNPNRYNTANDRFYGLGDYSHPANSSEHRGFFGAAR